MKIKIKPKDGLKVKKLNGDFLNPNGESVEKSVYWSRRLHFGEVELVGDEVKKPAPKPKKEKQIKENKKEASQPETNKEGE